MSESILVGREREIVREPAEPWRAQLEEALRVPSPRLAFMGREHHLVRDAAVIELARTGTAVSAHELAELTGIATDRVHRILDELESRLFFLVRNREGEVSWAFPVTSEPTPHRMHLSTGENVNAA